jgi:hypothetical protein
MIRRMSGDHRITAASAPEHPRTRQGPAVDVQFVTGQYRRAQASVVLALLLLAGTAVYLVAQQRQQTWGAARASVLDLALGLEASITGLLQQSIASLTGISADLSLHPTGAPSQPEQPIAVLRNAARFDPVSSYLGLRAADGHILAVDQSGGLVVGPDILRTIAQALAPHGTGLHVSDLVRLPTEDKWYVPITLDLGGSSDQPALAFALVPVRRLIGRTDSLRVIPDSYVSLVTTDGRLLVSYTPGTASLHHSPHQVSPQSLEQVRGRRSGVFLSLPSRAYYVGFARSTALPLYVSASVPIASLRRQWLGEAAAPVVVLATGVLAVLLFAWQLHRALRRQAAYVAEQEYLAQHDTLTGLRNRDGFMRELARAIAAAPRDPSAAPRLESLQRHQRHPRARSR